MCENVTDVRSCGHSTSYVQYCAEARRTGYMCENPRQITNRWASKCADCQRQRPQDEFGDLKEVLEGSHDDAH
ncbi:MAG: hypothetical protein M1831_004705 [Alyxoria varia]|nr:MAG: hypothetical protein M1831_004705 [Alyxoria varia]